MVSSVWLQFIHLMAHDVCFWSSHLIYIPMVESETRERAMSCPPKSPTQKLHITPLLEPLATT